MRLAAEHDKMILVHTPHLEDKWKGTRLILDVLRTEPRILPERVIIDHVEEHTIGMVLDAGFWAGITLYPESKCTPARAVDMFETAGGERLWLNCACDWGQSDPLAVPKAAVEMRRRGYSDEAIERLIFVNPLRFLSQSSKFRIRNRPLTRARGSGRLSTALITESAVAAEDLHDGIAGGAEAEAVDADHLAIQAQRICTRDP